MFALPLSFAAFLLAAPPSSAPAPAASAPAMPAGLEKLRAESLALGPMMRQALSRDFLAAVATLHPIPPRRIYRDPATKKFYSKADLFTFKPAERRKFESQVVDETLYFNTRYGTPLAYARPLELLGAAGLTSVEGKRILDYGYGTIGHLRLLATLGADAAGVDVDSLLPVLYSHPADTGPVKGLTARAGRITLYSGSFPSDEKIRKVIGDGYDLFLSKNTLKMGYIHPAEKVDPRMLVQLGVSDEAFVAAIHSILKPGGYAMIYNICPAPAKPGAKYIPWSDGRCPFPRAMWEKAGFKVLAFDADDSVTCRKMAHALGWDAGERPMDLENDLFAHYTLLQKP